MRPIPWFERPWHTHFAAKTRTRNALNEYAVLIIFGNETVLDG